MISQKHVDEAIDLAVFNGFSGPIPQTSLEVAVDMVCYDELFEKEDPETLKFFVDDYIRRHPDFFQKISV